MAEWKTTGSYNQYHNYYVWLKYTTSYNEATNQTTVSISGWDMAWDYMVNQYYLTDGVFTISATDNPTSSDTYGVWYGQTRNPGQDAISGGEPKTIVVQHGRGIDKKITISWSGYGQVGGKYKATWTDSTTVQTGTASTPSEVNCAAAYIGGNTTITINRLSPLFTHTLTYTFGALSGTIATKTSETSLTWAIPTTFYAQIPNAKSGQGVITCTTYNDTLTIGTTTCNFTVNCDEAQCKPTLNGSAKDTNATTVALTGNNQKFVKYFSNISVNTGATAKNSASIAAQMVSCGGKSISSGTGTISGVESGSVVFQATDSRGFTTQQTRTYDLVEYIKLTCTLNASAATTSGVATLKISGNYWNGNFGAANNTLTVQYRYKVKDGSYTNWTSATATATGNKYDITATISGLNYLNAYTFQARAIDKLSTVESNEQTRKTTPIFDWSEDDFNFNVSTTVKGDLSVSGGVSATGALVADSVSANSIKLNSKDIFSLLYPVGSVYISVNNTNPSTLFGGTWEQIKDKFLLAAGSTYNAGSTGGEATHTLTVSELPAHNHGIFYPNAGAGNDYAPIGYPNVGSKSTYWAVGSYTGDVGGGEAHNNMPPYLAVYVWKRTK